MKQQVQQQNSHPPNRQEPDQQQAVNVKLNFLSVLFFFALGLAITTATIVMLFTSKTVFLFLHNNLFIVGIITSTAVVIAIITFEHVSKTECKRLTVVCYVVNCMLPAFMVLSSSTQNLLKSAGYTIVTLLVVSLHSPLIPEHASRSMLGPLGAVNFIVTVMSTFRIVFKAFGNTYHNYFDDFTIYAGIFVYTGLLLVNIHRLVWNLHQQSFSSISSAFVLYINVMNLFARVLAFSSRDFYLYMLYEKSLKCESY